MMQDSFKKALSRFATGVCVVTFEHPDSQQPDGITISAFSSVSLEPLKVLFCLGNQGAAHQAFANVSRFAVCILSNEQKAQAYHFAGKDSVGKSEYFGVQNGVPVLQGTLATLICDKGNTHVEGDHDIIIGNVSDIVLADVQKSPLLYYQSTIIEDFQYV